MNKRKLVVVVALIKKNNKYFIGKRADDEEDNIGKWEFPGGKVEANEDEKSAIEREIMEELELNVKAVKYLTSCNRETDDLIAEFKLYECKYISGKIKLHAHSEYKWVSKKKLLNYDLPTPDMMLAYYVINNC